MKVVAYSIVIYFVMVTFFKFLGSMESNSWVNYYWLFSSAFYGVIFYKMKGFCDLTQIKNRYNKRDIKFYKRVISSLSYYWGVMFLVRLYVTFNIEKYNNIISGARKLTIGGTFIVLCLIFLTYQFRNDTKNER